MKPAELVNDINEVHRITGIEPGRIRFIELTFSEFFFNASPATQRTTFDERAIALLRKIHQQVFDQAIPVDTVRNELARSERTLKIIAVTSGKGGVGKTTLSVNLAIAAGRLGMRTLLFDGDMGLGNVHVFAGINPQRTVADLFEGRAGVEEILAAGPENVSVLCGGSGVRKLADVDASAIEYGTRELMRAARASFDVLVLDTGAGISAHVLHYLGMAAEIVVVTTPNIAATLDAYGVIKVARESSLPGKIHLVINQVADAQASRAVCERISDCARRFLQYAPSSLGYLTHDEEIERSNQNRRPFLISHPGSLNAMRVMTIAQTLCASRLDADSAPPPPAKRGREDFEKLPLRRSATAA